MLTTLLLLTLAGQQAEATPPPPPAKDKKVICRTEGTTGSRLGGRRVCHTREEWDAIAANARNDVENATGRLNTASGR